MKTFRAALESGKPQLGLCMMYPAPGIIERIGPDWDWVWIDGQHGQLGYQDILAHVRACNLIQRPAFVRVPGREYGHIGLALDTWADGLIVPMIDTADEARDVVQSSRFPPIGNRSYGGRRPIDLDGRLYADTADNDLVVLVQIESPEAIENAESIAAVKGVDGLFLGPDDVMIRRGYKMNAPRSKDTLGKDMTAVVAACRKQGKFACMPGAGAEMMTLCVNAGFNMIVGGGDVPFLATTSKTVSKEARDLVEKLTAGKAKKQPK